jgi:hypothetical protein
LLQTAGDSKGDPNQFTDGYAQSHYIVDPMSGWGTPVTVANTVEVFDSNLNYDHVPHPA